MSKFKVGDRVLAICGDDIKGMCGTVVNIDAGTIGVDFGGDFSGHNLDGEIKSKTGWYVLEGELELVREGDLPSDDLLRTICETIDLPQPDHIYVNHQLARTIKGFTEKLGMSNTTNYLRSKLSEDDQLLVDKDIVDEQGRILDSQFVLQVLLEQNKKLVVDAAKVLPEEDGCDC